MTSEPRPSVLVRVSSRFSDALRSERENWLDYVVILTVFIIVLGGLTLVREQYYPDSAHYLAMSLWFSGTPQQEALQVVYDRSIISGYEPNTSLAVLFDWGLVKPRVVLPVLSIPFMWIFGQEGLAVTTGLISLVLVVALYKFLSRHYGRSAAVVSLILMMSSLSIMAFSIAMLTESLSAVWGVLALAAAFRFQKERHWGWIVAIIAITLLSAFTRQATFIVAGAFVVAFLLSLFNRSERHKWGLPALAAAGTALAAQVIQTLLFPFSQGDQYMRMTGTDTLWGALLATPQLVKNIAVQEFNSLMSGDQALIVLLVLCAISMVIFWRRTETHLLLGALAGIALYNITNGNATHFRYAVPGIVFFLTSLSLLVNHIQVKVVNSRASSANGLEIPTSALRSN
jgi:hypothetical protein